MTEYMQKTFDEKLISKTEVQETRNNHELYRTRRDSLMIELKKYCDSS